jgi:hypothetical protein
MAQLFSFFKMLGAAQRAGNAARNHRTPSAADLLVLGISKDAFGRR